MGRHRATSVNPQQTVEDAFEHILRTSLSSVEDWEPVALAGEDIEGVHQVRVELRRMRSTLTVFRSAIPRRATRSLAKELRWAAKALDRARDLDVYIADNLSSGTKKEETKMRRIAMKHREDAYSRVRRLIQGKRYAGIKADLTQWLDTRGWRVALSQDERKVLRRKITPFANRVLEEHRAQILEDGNEIETLDSEALHQLRINCKKLRYATEFFAPLYGGRMKGFTKHLKQLQDLLGTVHDTAVMTGLQQDLLKGNGSTKLKRMAGKLEDEREKEAEEIVKTLVERWTVFSEAERPWVRARKPTVSSRPRRRTARKVGQPASVGMSA